MARGHVVAFVGFVALAAGVPRVARAGTGGAGESLVDGVLAGQGPVGAVVVLLCGGVLLAVCVDRLVEYLTRAALGLRVSLFALAVVFTGFEVDDTVLAVTLSAGDLESAALGTALGTGLAIVGVTLALAALVRPFPVDLPADYVVLFGAAPLVLVPLVLVERPTSGHGLVLVGVCVAVFGYLLVRERRRDAPVFRESALGRTVRTGASAIPTSAAPLSGQREHEGERSESSAVAPIPEDRVVAGRRAGWIWIALALVALLGVVVASTLLEAGAEAAIDGLGIEQTVFGATVLTALLTVEDVLLTVEPVRRGFPEIGVGNVIGSVLFSVTGNVGVILLAGDLAIAGSVPTVHLPALVLLTAVAAYALSRGRLERRHGALLGGLYVLYLVLALVVFGGVPVGD